MLKNIFAVATLVSALNVQAADLSYSHVDIGFGKVEVDNDWGGYDGDALGLGLSVAAGDIFYFTAELVDADMEFDDQQTTSFGVGAHAALSENTDVYAEVSYVRVDVEINYIAVVDADGGVNMVSLPDQMGSLDIDDNGVGYLLGLRSMLTEKFELGGGISRVDVFDSAENSFFVNGHYYFTETFGVGAEYSIADDVDAYSISLRVNF